MSPSIEIGNPGLTGIRNTQAGRGRLRGGGALLSLTSVGNRPNLIPDALLAAIAIQYGLTLCPTDADFARFDGLRWENPLKG